jgi:hypothetical protein
MPSAPQLTVVDGRKATWAGRNVHANGPPKFDILRTGYRPQSPGGRKSLNANGLAPLT